MGRHFTKYEMELLEAQAKLPRCKGLKRLALYMGRNYSLLAQKIMTLRYRARKGAGVVPQDGQGF